MIDCFQFMREAIYRDEVQKWILEANPDWLEKMVGTKEPDGSEHLTDEAIDAFNVPHCPKCGPGSILKTDVVFFGDNLRGTDVSTTYEKVSQFFYVLKIFYSAFGITSSLGANIPEFLILLY